MKYLHTCMYSPTIDSSSRSCGREAKFSSLAPMKHVLRVALTRGSLAGLLFHRGVLMSGSALSPWALVRGAANYAMQVAKHLNCSSVSTGKHTRLRVPDCRAENYPATRRSIISLTSLPPRARASVRPPSWARRLKNVECALNVKFNSTFYTRPRRFLSKIRLGLRS